MFGCILIWYICFSFTPCINFFALYYNFTICCPNKINKIRETFYSLSTYWWSMEEGYKPDFEKWVLDIFEN